MKNHNLTKIQYIFETKLKKLSKGSFEITEIFDDGSIEGFGKVEAKGLGFHVIYEVLITGESKAASTWTVHKHEVQFTKVLINNNLLKGLDYEMLCEVMYQWDFIDFNLITEKFPVNQPRIVSRSEDLDLKFYGYLMASAVSNVFNNRYMELRLYKTQTEQYVVQRIKCSLEDAEIPYYEVITTSDEGEIYDFLGFGYLSKELYDEAGITPIEEI